MPNSPAVITLSGLPLADLARLRRAYRATDYQIHSRPPIVLRVGGPVAGLADWLATGGCDTALVITAFNPFSRPTPATENLQQQEALQTAVRASGLSHVAAEGVGRDGAWPPEPSLCVFDAPAPLVDTWLIAFSQAAVVVADAQGCRLVWHPGLRAGLPPDPP